MNYYQNQNLHLPHLKSYRCSIIELNHLLHLCLHHYHRLQHHYYHLSYHSTVLKITMINYLKKKSTVKYTCDIISSPLISMFFIMPINKASVQPFITITFFTFNIKASKIPLMFGKQLLSALSLTT